MAAKNKDKVKKAAAAAAASKKETESEPTPTKAVQNVIEQEHLPPLLLISTVLVCSGSLWVLGLRDMMATGRNILGPMDEAYLSFTKSTEWYDDSKGWKSTMGGFSTIQQVTTDANNMGGLFVRKVCGGAFFALQLHKLFPFLFHTAGAQWKRGHFRPLLKASIIANLSLITFFGLYLEDFGLAGADDLPKMIIGILAFETMAFVFYLRQKYDNRPGPAVAMPPGKTPTSVPSRSLCRTVAMVSSLMVLIAGRDLFFPGHIIKFIPRDDIYLEWTGAFIHSPPEGSPEAAEQGLEAPLYIGDKFLSQLLALNVLLLCLYKVVSSFFIRFGSDGSGEIKGKMIWRPSAIGCGLLVFLFRLFTPAARSASLDLRWHLMSMAYECFILGLLCAN